VTKCSINSVHALGNLYNIPKFLRKTEEKSMSKANDNNNQAADNPNKWAKINTAEGEVDHELEQPESAEGFSEEEVLESVAEDDVAAVPDAEDSLVISLRTEVADLQEQLLRKAADEQNLRTRMSRDVQAAHKFASAKFIEAMLPVVDSLERALEITPTEGDDKMRAGIQMTITMFEKVLSDNGVITINPDAGVEFDPDQHAAMSAQNDPKQVDNTIISVMQKGYNLNGRVVRAAMVVVNKH
jgi:molecular chaperone GrpE